MAPKKRLSQIHPLFYKLAVWKNIQKRHLQYIFNPQKFSHARNSENLSVLYFEHRSLLRRRLGTTSMDLQEGKVLNLKRVQPLMDGLILGPGESFSFWKTLGKPSAARGFVPGLVLRGESTDRGIGGGLCQLANLLYWMALNSPLEVLERHHHSLDFFPDNHRQVPFGAGASVMYNYLDLVLRNPLPFSAQIRIGLTDRFLTGEIRFAEAPAQRIQVQERNHHFYPQGSGFIRYNEIWKQTWDSATGDLLSETLVVRNSAKVLYGSEWIPPAEVRGPAEQRG